MITQINNPNAFYGAKIRKPLAFRGETTPKVISPDEFDKKALFKTLEEYVKIDSQSTEDGTAVPSTEGQKVINKVLEKKLKAMKLADVKIDKNGVVVGTLPSNLDDAANKTVIGLLAHYDTSSSLISKNIVPIIHENYKGGDLKLPKNGTVIKAFDLKDWADGRSVMTASGDTILGADDKAGITIALAVIDYFQKNPGVKHPAIKLLFTPDEETGKWNSTFDNKDFGLSFAYTIDGTKPNEVEVSSFNAFNPEIEVLGRNVHCGYAAGKLINDKGDIAPGTNMINANRIVSEINTAFPGEAPENTRGSQGYYHPMETNGDESKATGKYLIRDFDMAKALKRVEDLKNKAKEMVSKYPGVRIFFKPNERYHNMQTAIEKFPDVYKVAMEAIERMGMKPEIALVRGGTDGSTLTLNKGVFTPNLGADMINFHGPQEAVSDKGLAECAAVVANTILVATERNIKPPEPEKAEVKK